jgi:hypothetical protein
MPIAGISSVNRAADTTHYRIYLMMHPLLKSATLLLGLGTACAVAASDMIAPEQAVRSIGKDGLICGLVERARYAEGSEGQPTFLHMGGAFPRHTFSVRIPGSARSSFGFDLESLQGKTICASGRIARDASRAEIEVRSPSAIKLASIK